MVVQRGGTNKGPQSSEVGKGPVGPGPGAEATGLAGRLLLESQGRGLLRAQPVRVNRRMAIANHLADQPACFHYSIHVI